jgi:outer membrane protein assembly factor BamD (BamD/ComL family)
MAALKAGDAASALDALDEHARRFPNGILAEERASQRVVALCSAGRIAEAQAEGERFLREHPLSPAATRVRGACLATDKSVPK